MADDSYRMGYNSEQLASDKVDERHWPYVRQAFGESDDPRVVTPSVGLPVSSVELQAGEDLIADVQKVEHRYNLTLVASAGADNIIKAGPGFLHAIIVGTGGTGTVEVSDHVSDGDANLKIVLTNPPVGVYRVDGIFANGITADIGTVTNITFVWR